MSHRIREAMIDTDPTPLGGKGEFVEADETPQNQRFAIVRTCTKSCAVSRHRHGPCAQGGWMKSVYWMVEQSAKSIARSEANLLRLDRYLKNALLLRDALRNFARDAPADKVHTACRIVLPIARAYGLHAIGSRPRTSSAESSMSRP
jgi:hypothetical protein